MTTVLRRMLLPLSIAAFAVAAAPAILTTPFISQGDAHLTWGYWCDRLGLPFALLILIVALIVTTRSWRTSPGWFGRMARILAILVAASAVWVSTVNFAEWMFRPASESRYVPLADTAHLQADDLVLGLQREDQALIYPVAIVGYHHILNERLKGEPFVVTY